MCFSHDRTHRNMSSTLTFILDYLYYGNYQFGKGFERTKEHMRKYKNKYENGISK